MKLVWFRNDLRVTDHHALYEACRLNPSESVMAVAVISPIQWKLQDEAKCRVQFWLENLRSVQEELSTLNIPLKIIRVASNQELSSQFVDLVKKNGITQVFFNREYPAYEQKRDDYVTAALESIGIKVSVFDSDLVFPPGSVTNQQGEMYRVFTPFSKAWRAKFYRMPQLPLPKPSTQSAVYLNGLPVQHDEIPQSIGYPISIGADWNPDLWPVGTEETHVRLKSFIEEHFSHYSDERDIPAKPATSGMSPYLSVGAISVRQCIAAAQTCSADEEWFENQWITELIWREFYRHLLVAYPEMNRWEPFKPDIEARAQWLEREELFAAWCAGETGFAIVDAGMKQLKETGWMHNRVRMITASFLTKLLREDWRLGARFFMNHLIDGDFASNMGGWQWSASVGADAAPYFRIFNPMRQAERFDKTGLYVSQWIPELRDLNSVQQHDPLYSSRLGRPIPIIDYGKAREESLAAYNQ